MKRILFLFLVFINFMTSCQENELRLKGETDFTKLCADPLYQKYGGVKAVKIVYDLQNDQIYFVSGSKYQYHYEFCFRELGYNKSLSEFNVEMYSNSNRREYLLANINYFPDIDVYALELGPSDKMPLNELKLIYKKVVESSFIGSDLRLFLNTDHVNDLNIKHDVFSTLRPEEVYKNQTFQNINSGETIGFLRVINNWEVEKDSISPNDIIITQEIPLVIPQVKAIIVSSFQTPLSHVSILAKNRDIPVCVYTNVFSDSTIKELNKSIVKLEVDQLAYKISAWNKGVRPEKPKPKIKLKKNLKVNQIVALENSKEKDISFIGNKASNFAVLMKYSRTIDFKTPEISFAIPFYFYEKHLEKAGVLSLIEDLNSNPINPEQRLENLRSIIENTDVDSCLIKEIALRLKNTNFTKFRFRSSTNAEDRADFSGAGLYDSKTVDLNSAVKTIQNGLQSVWASMWNSRAFNEREVFNIDHHTASMGVLVHRSFPDEEANGVAITTNLYRDDYLGFVVNVQLGDESVVEPKNGIECDAFICYPTDGVSNVDVINYSSLNNGQLVMTMGEITHLTNVLEAIKEKYFSRHFVHRTYHNFALDLEFKLDEGTRELYIKQMRIYRK